jgi:hypothetical protein
MRVAPPGVEPGRPFGPRILNPLRMPFRQGASSGGSECSADAADAGVSPRADARFVRTGITPCVACLRRRVLRLAFVRDDAPGLAGGRGHAGRGDGRAAIDLARRIVRAWRRQHALGTARPVVGGARRAVPSIGRDVRPGDPVIARAKGARSLAIAAVETRGRAGARRAVLGDVERASLTATAAAPARRAARAGVRGVLRRRRRASPSDREPENAYEDQEPHQTRSPICASTPVTRAPDAMSAAVASMSG